MKKARLILYKEFSVVMLVLLGMLTSCVPAGKDELTEGFLNPLPQARPHAYWFWMSGNITRDGITADLEAMAESGIGGALIFNTGESHGTEVPPGPVDYMSNEWLDLFKFAVTEADRLGLTLGANNCAGW